MKDVKSAEFEVKMSGEIEPTDDVTASSLGVPGKIDFEMNLSGAYDNNLKEDVKFELSLDAGGSLEEGEEENFSGEMRIVNNTLYFALTGLSDFGGQVPTMFVTPYLNKWWAMVLPDEYMSVFQTYAGDESEMTAEEKKLMDLVENTEFFKNIEYAGEDELDGSAVWKYNVELDQEAMIDYMKESSKIYGADTGLTDADVDEIAEMYRSLEFEGEIWIAQEDVTARKFSGEMDLSGLEGIEAEFDFDYRIWNLNGEVAVEVPADAEVFDPLALMMGAGAMGGGVDPSYTGVPSDFGEGLPEGFEVTY